MWERDGGSFPPTAEADHAYSNWSDDQPNNLGDEDCLWITVTQYYSIAPELWADRSCDTSFAYVCQAPLSPPPSPLAPSPEPTPPHPPTLPSADELADELAASSLATWQARCCSAEGPLEGGGRRLTDIPLSGFQAAMMRTHTWYMERHPEVKRAFDAARARRANAPYTTPTSTDVRE